MAKSKRLQEKVDEAEKARKALQETSEATIAVLTETRERAEQSLAEKDANLKAALEQSAKLQGMLNAKMQALDRERGERERFVYWQPTGLNPLHHRDYSGDRGGLVFEARRLLYHSAQGSRTFWDL